MNCAIHTDVPAAAFCRTCGKALCNNCKREVMGAIYCEPCIAARLQGGATGAPISAVPVSGTPSPALATLLGFIPGVGAMYNGQFVKAFIHLVIFACLIVLTSEVHGLFGLLIGFFVIYMVFDAHQTARARQFGMPSPDFLGLDRMFGVQENEPPRTPANAQAGPGQAAPAAISRHNAPVGPIILVALGVFFLIDNFHPHFFRHLWPLLLIGLGVWVAFKRSAGRG